MYRILVADDEPTAIRHICNMIATRCPLFEVTETAEHGRQALSLMEECRPDVLITDVKMPGMDGITLANKVKERYPEVFTLIVSGYQEFEYAKAAIQSGVYDYLLKPIKPSALQSAMESLREQLDGLYAQKRNRLMKSLCEKNDVAQKELERYFPGGRYYAAIVRKNGLPGRYFGNSGFEIFSGKDEKIYLYGRDEMETLYLCPEDIPVYKSFYQIIAETIRREYRHSNYVTGVIKETPFGIADAGAVFEQLYLTLDSNIIIGKSQILTIEEMPDAMQADSDQETHELRALENNIQKAQREKIIESVGKLFTLWQKMGKTQMYVESQVRYLLILLERNNFLSGAEHNIERLLDEIFYFAESMEDVADAIQDMLDRNIKIESMHPKMDTSEFFEKVVAYIDRNIATELSIKRICKEFALSPTYLNKLSRKYSGQSFNKYLTLARIERAKEIMREQEICYVKDVANLVGYHDQFYFSRIFTSVVGISPSDYMERKEEGGNTDERDG